MNLAVGAQRLIAGLRVEVAGDRDRHVVQLVGEEREASHTAAKRSGHESLVEQAVDALRLS